MAAVSARSLLRCNDVDALLGPAVDGELLAEESLSVRLHIESCAGCRARLDEIRRVKTLLFDASTAIAPPLPDGLVDDVRSAIRRDGGRRSWVRAGAAAIAAVAVASVIALFVKAPTPHGHAQTENGVGAAVAAAVLERHKLDVPVDVASPDPRRVQEFLAARVGHLLVVPHLEPVGFGLQGGRVVDVDSRRGAQLVYTGGFGQRLSVLALPDPDGALAARALAGDSRFSSSSEGIAVRLVAKDGALYGIAGDVDDEHIDSVAHVLER